MRTLGTWGALVLLLIFLQPSLQLRSCGSNKKNFEIWEGACYLFEYEYSLNFDSAKKKCENVGATLVSISSQEEMDYVHKKMKTILYYNYWIGMRKDKNTPGNLKDRYYWLDGSTVTYDNWAPGEPNDRNDYENCIEVYYSGGLEKQWNDVPCSNYKYGIGCKAPFLEGWQEFNGNEYFVSYESEDVKVSWYMARNWCMDKGGDLVSITSLDEADQVAKWANINEYQGGLWIGLNKLGDQRIKWGWSDKTSYSFELWADGYPQNKFLGNLCGYVDSKDSKGKWMNGHCSDKNKGFICERQKGSTIPKTDPPTVSASGYCPQGFIANGNKCFKVVSLDNKNGVTFEEATRRCRAERGILPDIASISSELDQAFITSQLQDITYGVWIGLYRPSYGDDWRWADSERTIYTNWAPNEPSNSNHHCAEAWVLPGPRGTWNNLDCKSKRGFVCETYKDASNPINTPPSTTTHSCPSGFTPYWYGCFKYQESPMTWEEAQKACSDLSPNANLVGIHAEPENAAVMTIVLSKGYEIWTGFRDQQLLGEYTWQDNWATFYTNWAEGQPRRENDQAGCVKMSYNGKWSDTTCTNTLPSVCKISQIGAITTPATRPGRCPSRDGWEEYHEHCYYFEPYGYTNWQDAKSACQKLGLLASLASIHSAMENKWISDKVEGIGGGRRSVWIGLYRSKQDQTFHWSDGSALQYEAWAPGEPNGKERDENCVELYNQYWPERWNDHYCNDYKGYVCKAPKLPDVTLPTQPPYCPSGWKYYKKACYLFRPDVNLMYSAAQKECNNIGGEAASLASIHDWEENFFIEEEMYWGTDLPKHNDFWIGMTKLKANQPYVWDDGTEVDFENWAPGEPNSGDNDNENCVETYVKTGRWNDAFCTLLRGMVCKMPAANAGEGLSGGAVAGIVIGVLIAVIIGMIVVIIVLVQRQIIRNPIEVYGIPNPVQHFNITNPFSRGKTGTAAAEGSEVQYEKTP